MRLMSREPARRTVEAASAGRTPGEITGPAQEVLKGDATAPVRLYALVAPRLRALARRHLQNTKGDLDLSPEEVASLTMKVFVGTADFDLRSRQQFFEFADRVAASIVERAAEGGTRDTDHLLLDASKRTRREAALGQAIREITQIDADLAQVLRARYVLNLKPVDLAAFRDEPEGVIQKRWRRAEALLSAKYKGIEESGRSVASSLDSKTVDGYAGVDPLSPHSVLEDPDSKPAVSEALAELREENARLRSELVAARNRIANLEAKPSRGPGLDTSETRHDIDALFSPPALEKVPLFAGRTSEELFQHLDEHYGRWLTYFGAERDAISLDHIRRHDPRFVDKLAQRISRLRKSEREQYGEARTPTLGEMMPTEADRGDLALAGTTVSELFEPSNRDVAALVSSRLIRHLYSK